MDGMIKRIRFLRPGETAAPADVAPVRVEVGTVLGGLCAPQPPRYEQIVIEWFPDGTVLPQDRGTDMIVEEVVRRGADWLDSHRASGAPAYKHIAVARRAQAITTAEFKRRWHVHAGQIQAKSGTYDIPDVARGNAYLQNHPAGACPTYDAINEVYFEDMDALRERVEWFASNPPIENDLFGPSWFFAVHAASVLTPAVG